MTLETGCYIDNSGGVYSQDEILDRLIDIGREVGAKLGRWPKGSIVERDGLYGPQICYEIEIEIIDKINDALIDTDLILSLYEGAYCIVHRDDFLDEEW